MNREYKRRLNSKVNKLSQDEIDAIINQYMYNILSMSVFKRVKFGLSVIFRR